MNESEAAIALSSLQRTITEAGFEWLLNDPDRNEDEPLEFNTQHELLKLLESLRRMISEGSQLSSYLFNEMNAERIVFQPDPSDVVADGYSRDDSIVMQRKLLESELAMVAQLTELTNKIEVLVRD